MAENEKIQNGGFLLRVVIWVKSKRRNSRKAMNDAFKLSWLSYLSNTYNW